MKQEDKEITLDEKILCDYPNVFRMIDEIFAEEFGSLAEEDLK